MTAHYLSSYIFSDAVKIFTGKKQSLRRGKKRLGPGVMGVGRSRERKKEGGKEKLTADSSSFSSGKKRSRLVFSHKHKNAINKAEMIDYYLREQL